MMRIRNFLFGEEAATAVEYAVMLALVLMVVFASVVLLGNNTRQSWENMNGDLNSVGFGSGS